MARYVAFLRGVNLGKNRRVKNEALKSAFAAGGFEAVETFRASGNVAFEATRASDERIASAAEAALAAELGFEVTVFVRSAKETVAIAAQEPFDEEAVAASKGKLQVALLATKPTAAGRRKALAMAGEGDLLAIRGRELYWLPSAGTLETELDLKALESVVGPWTMRTMGTIEQLAAKYCG
jgi:uncharacterized protein (DUF1697 family)